MTQNVRILTMAVGEHLGAKQTCRLRKWACGEPLILSSLSPAGIAMALDGAGAPWQTLQCKCSTAKQSNAAQSNAKQRYGVHQQPLHVTLVALLFGKKVFSFLPKGNT